MSSGSESDDDYVPEDPGQVSEEESADEETNVQYEQEVEHKTKKRKSELLSKGKKKIKTRNGIKEIKNQKEEEPDITEPASQNPEEDKKREDDLWSKFLEGTDTKPKSTMTEPKAVQPTKSSNSVMEPKITVSKKEKEHDKDRERRIFEFAGETVVVENDMIKERTKTPETVATVSKLEEKSRSRGSGLSGILGQLNKKNTLSTLEKSKLDWNTYKKEEGVEEEIASINKGKAGFLERRDFLERADLRQYEIERDLRMSKRSKR